MEHYTAIKKSIDKSNNVDESQKHHAQQKKPNTKEHHLQYDYTYMKVKNRLN